MTLYETLAQRYIDDIKAQRLPAGSRLPALRVMAKQHQVSMTTATKAYDYLQQTGWIYSQPQSGYFVANQASSPYFSFPLPKKSERRDPKQFAPLRGYQPYSDQLRPLVTSMISPQLQPMVALQRCIKRVTQRSEKHLFHYPEEQGSLALRQALSQHFRQGHFTFSSEEVVITNGCLDAVRLAIESTTKEGDTLAISSPCFSGLLDLLATLSRNIIEIRCDENGLDIEQLEECMAQGLIQATLFSTSHMNPTGITLSAQQKQALAQLAVKYRVPMIEDDVYYELGHQKQPLPAKYWDQKGYVIWCGSFSKTLAAGLRLGWSLPGCFIDRYITCQSSTNFGVNSLLQASLAEFINTGEYRTHVNRIRRTLSKQVYTYRQFLSDHLPTTTKISAPEGGMVLWLQIPGLDTIELARQTHEQGVEICSGIGFSTHDLYHDCLRINCGWPLTTDGKINGIQQQLATLCQLIQANI